MLTRIETTDQDSHSEAARYSAWPMALYLARYLNVRQPESLATVTTGSTICPSMPRRFSLRPFVPQSDGVHLGTSESAPSHSPAVEGAGAGVTMRGRAAEGLHILI